MEPLGLILIPSFKSFSPPPPCTIFHVRDAAVTSCDVRARGAKARDDLACNMLPCKDSWSVVNSG